MLDVTRCGAVLRPPKTGVSGARQCSASRPAPELPCSAARADRLHALLAAAQDRVDEAVFLGLGGGHDLVAVDVLTYLLHRLVGVLGEQLLELGTHPHDLPGLDLDVRALAVPALGGRLVDDDPR